MNYKNKHYIHKDKKKEYIEKELDKQIKERYDNIHKKYNDCKDRLDKDSSYEEYIDSKTHRCDN